MAEIEFKFDPKPLRSVMRELRKGAVESVNAVLGKFAVLITGEAQKESPVGPTGNLKRSHLYQMLRPGRWLIGATVDYAAVVHATNPTKAFWFMRTLATRGPSLLRELMAQEFEKRFGGSSAGDSGEGTDAPVS